MIIAHVTSDLIDLRGEKEKTTALCLSEVMYQPKLTKTERHDPGHNNRNDIIVSLSHLGTLKPL